MPPKKNKESKKTEQKKKDRVVQDKTFGLKNKKGAKQQRFVKQVEQQVKHSGDPRNRKIEEQRRLEKKRKEEEKKKQAEIDALFRQSIIQPKLGQGVDPKSVLCQFFKMGKCTKAANKCKYSHDLAIERKSEKRNIYANEDEDKENDKMEDWDEKKLAEVVQKKHGAHNTKIKKKNKTAIVCKHFIRAIEKKKYGWFWQCPNKDACIYKHALPPGYVLKSDLKKKEDQTEKISIEELVEKERAALGPNTTKVTLQSFLAWKEKKRAEKIKQRDQQKKKRKNDFKSGKALVSGREVFEFGGDVGGDDATEGGDVVEYKRQEDNEGKKVSNSMFVPTEVDEKLAKVDRFVLNPNMKKFAKTEAADGDKPTETSQDAPAEGNTPEQNPNQGECPETKMTDDLTDVPVDESLFAEEFGDEFDDLEI